MNEPTMRASLRDQDPETAMVALEAFFDRWLGPRHHGYRGDLTDMSADAPAALRALYEKAGNWPCASPGKTAPLFGGYWPQNILVTPARWTQSNGHTIFAVENQGVCSWAFDADGDDPAVFQHGEDGVHQASGTLSSFLVNWCLNEILIGRWLKAIDRLEANYLTRPESIELLAELANAKFELFDSRFLVRSPAVMSAGSRDYGLLDLSAPHGALFAPYLGLQAVSKADSWAWTLQVSELGGVVIASQKIWHLRQVLPAGSLDREIIGDLFTQTFEDREAAECRTLASLRRHELQGMDEQSRRSTVKTGFLADAMVAQIYRLVLPLLTDQLQTSLRQGSPLDW